MIATVREHTFFQGPLRPSSYVLDLGANRGEFAEEVARRYGVTCIAVEPTSDLAGGIRADGVRVHQLAVGDVNGELTLHVSENPEASSLFAGTDSVIGTEMVSVMTLEALLAHEGIESVALAKVDIEGAELGVFTQTPDEVLRCVAQFSVEFHTFTGALTEGNIKRIASRLRGLGFEYIRFSAGHSNWLFFQPARCNVRRLEVLLTRHVVRNVRGAARRAGLICETGLSRDQHRAPPGRVGAA
jgi:FkbM family methyltransferase